VAAVVRRALVKHRGHVDLQSGTAQGDPDRVLGDHEVVGVLGRAVHLDAPVPQPLQQAAFVGLDTADTGRADVGRNIGIRSLALPAPDRRVLGGTPGRAEFHQVVARVGGDVLLDPRTQVVDLPAARLRLTGGHVDLVLRVPGEHPMVDMAVWHRPSFLVQVF
jgi:hypothetical protein